MHHNEKISHRSIDKKVALLEIWARDGVPQKTDPEGHSLVKNGDPVYADVPNTLNKFLRWSDVKEDIKSTGQQALSNYLQDKKLNDNYVPSLLSAVQHKLAQQKLENSKSDLKAQLKEAWKLINSQNKDIAKFMNDINSLNEEISALKAEQENIEMAAALKLEAMEKELASSQRQLANLRKFRAV